jgi:branched-subunit amino acid aminotransferase/4-amino-4-deoxychorismate lyase
MTTFGSTPIVSSPRADAGVFETILIWDDQPVELDAHLVRLAGSARALFGSEPPDGRRLVLDHSRGGGIGRLRLDLQPTASGALKASVIVAPFDPLNVFPVPPRTTDLASIVLDRGYGEHKWADRDVLTRAEAAVGPGAAPLLVGADGTVFEASRANIFAVRDGGLLTPPLDGSILPGVARAGVLATAAELGIEHSEERLDLEALQGADEVFLTGSLRGVEPVRALDGTEFEVAGPVSTALAEALKRRWFGAL